MKAIAAKAAGLVVSTVVAWRTTWVILALVGSLTASTVATAPPAEAWEHTRTGVATWNAPVAPHPMEFREILRAYWNVKTAAQCHSLYPCFGDFQWTRDYEQGVMFFDHWYEPIDDAGRLSNGVAWRSRKQLVSWEFCVVPWIDFAFCARHVGWVKIVIRTDGTSTVTTGLNS